MQNKVNMIKSPESEYIFMKCIKVLSLSGSKRYK